jgi:hypothetical protein
MSVSNNGIWWQAISAQANLACQVKARSAGRSQNPIKQKALMEFLLLGHVSVE